MRHHRPAHAFAKARLLVQRPGGHVLLEDNEAELAHPEPAARGVGLREQAPADAATPVSLSRTVVRTLQPMSLACVRHTGPYEDVPISLWDTLIDWAHRHDIRAPHVLLGIAHDAPGITRPENLRFDAAIRVPSEFRSGKRVGHQRFAGGLFALTTSVGIDPSAFSRALAS